MPFTAIHRLSPCATKSSIVNDPPVRYSAWRRSVCCAGNGRVPQAKSKQFEDGTVEMEKFSKMKQKVEFLGIDCDDSTKPGFYSNLFCPKCKGGGRLVRSLSFHVMQTGEFAVWRCFHLHCGWAGQAFADGEKSSTGVCTNMRGLGFAGQITEESLGLEPLGYRLISYFAERKISVETLTRNAVKQLSGNQNVIAFTYRRKGQLVGCKYRSLDKRFWQEKGTERALYGLDDISKAEEIVIVEGEIDKLSMEEAGIFNCVSVPSGAPGKVSNKELPSPDQDSAYQYLWNCKDYLSKVSRIILATDGDAPGQALAEELMIRLGKQRCWRVSWPKKDEFSCFKDANEVLKHLGPSVLRQVIEHVESCSSPCTSCQES